MYRIFTNICTKNHPNVGKYIPYMERREASIFLPAKVEKAPHARLGARRGGLNDFLLFTEIKDDETNNNLTR
jgi:hypothetical protein